ncbi:uncharacterized protein LOC135341506 [Halichondria panicea]|uniref:uncharacterized protein LOC135341506 n=1 Tax=Halichondria panicea TaxID=6063 RepID=UPI00312B6730
MAGITDVKYIIDFFKLLTEEGNKLVESLQDINKAVIEIESNKNELQEAAKKQEIITDPEVSEQICNLENDLEKCTALAKAYVFACTSMARYATKQEIAQEIDEELTQGKFNTLKSFIVIFLRQLKTCTERLTEYVGFHDNLVSRMNGLTRKWHQRAAEKSALAEKAKMTVGCAFLHYGMYKKVGIAILVTGIACPPTVICVAYAVQLNFERRRLLVADKFIEHKEVQAMFEKAVASAEELKALMNKNKQAIDEMERETKEATTAINTIVAHYLNKALVLNSAELKDIQNSLQDFRSSMNDILSKVGRPDEEEKFDRRRVLSNTIAEQPSDADTDGDRHKMMLDLVYVPKFDRRDEEPYVPEPIQEKNTGGLSTAVAMRSLSTRSQEEASDEDEVKIQKTQSEKEGSDDEEDLKKT